MTKGCRRAVFGRLGDEVAAAHLAERDLAVLSRRRRCREGEIDLVARDGDGRMDVAAVRVDRRARATRLTLHADAVSGAWAGRG